MRIYILITFCFLASLTQLKAQVVADSVAYKLSLLNNKEVEVLRTDLETTIQEIQKRTDWKPYDSIYINLPEKANWLKFKIKNKSNDTIRNFLYSNHNYVTTYQKNDTEFIVSKNGNLFSLSERTNKREYHFTKIELLPLQESLIYVRLNSNTNVFLSRSLTLYSEIGYWQFSRSIIENQSKPIGLIYFYIITLITIFIFALVFWLRLQEELYIYYLGYLFFQIIYGLLVLRATSANLGNIAAYIPEISTNFFQPAQFIFIGFYIFFILHLLTVKKYDKLLAKILAYLGLFCFIYAIGHFIFGYFFFGLKFAEVLFVVIRSFILPLNFILIFWIIYKVKHPLLIYFIFGQSFFFIGAVLASYVGYAGLQAVEGHFFNFTQAPNIIFQLGLLAEVFCFSLALGKNIFLLQQEKEIATDDLIAQLRENKLLQEGMNRELDEIVNKKTDELIQLYSEIELEREQKIKNDFNQRLKETEMIALRSQMNPHFIFNSLSAIKYLMMTARNDDAINYLDDFSSLLRGILQNSNRKEISVEEELEILELYLSLEQNRMGTEFKYTIEVSSREELSQYHIPPLLLQPIVENAIWHGLHPSLKAEKTLKIIFDTTEYLKIIIEDNGIGRKESSKKVKLHSSMGANIIQDRLTLFNHLNDYSIRLKTMDLEKNGNALGTRIILTYQY